MTALTRSRFANPYMERWTYHLFILATGNKAYKGGQAFLNPATGKVVVGGNSSPDLLYIGTFYEEMDATSGDKLVNVNLGMEIEVRWWANQGDIAVTDVGKIAYSQDDQTVKLAPGGSAPIGRIWAVDTANGVAVQKLDAFGGAGAGGSLFGEFDIRALPAYAANDAAIGADPASRALYDIATTAAATTVTLPASADEGTVLYFSADGVKNGHTVTYRDATGLVALTTALTASKRHLVIATFLAGTWRANAYVSP